MNNIIKYAESGFDDDMSPCSHHNLSKVPTSDYYPLLVHIISLDALIKMIILYIREEISDKYT
jgi:hypothetical protein